MESEEDEEAKEVDLFMNPINENSVIPTQRSPQERNSKKKLKNQKKKNKRK